MTVTLQCSKPFVYAIIGGSFIKKRQPVITGKRTEIHTVHIGVLVTDGHGVRLYYKCKNYLNREIGAFAVGGSFLRRGLMLALKAWL